ncbi:IclR family transcriptional regulator [Streptomyces sp. NPDC091377]|uniref:IclR family transcriptional regulator n=1 Tax=Streptomyces sp. NPDC091377 TaxID=3365995 RepID=UPI0038175FE5
MTVLSGVPADASGVRPRRSDDLPRTGPADTSAAKVLVLLDAFRGPKTVLGVTELAHAVGVPKSTAHRLLAIMVDSGFVRKIGGRYGLTERLFEVGNRAGSSAIRSTGLRRRAMPYLTELHSGSRDTVHLATLSGTDVLYLEKLFGHSTGSSPTAVGTRWPAHATALGKAMLAHASDEQLAPVMAGPFQRFTARTVRSADRLERELTRVREEGLAYDEGELRDGMHCVAVPILDPETRTAVAAVSVCSLRTQSLKRHAPRLLAMARDLSRAAA